MATVGCAVPPYVHTEALGKRVSSRNDKRYDSVGEGHIFCAQHVLVVDMRRVRPDANARGIIASDIRGCTLVHDRGWFSAVDTTASKSLAGFPSQGPVSTDMSHLSASRTRAQRMKGEWLSDRAKQIWGKKGPCTESAGEW